MVPTRPAALFTIPGVLGKCAQIGSMIDRIRLMEFDGVVMLIRSGCCYSVGEWGHL